MGRDPAVPHLCDAMGTGHFNSGTKYFGTPRQHYIIPVSLWSLRDEAESYLARYLLIESRERREVPSQQARVFCAAAFFATTISRGVAHTAPPFTASSQHRSASPLYTNTFLSNCPTKATKMAALPSAEECKYISCTLPAPSLHQRIQC